MYPKRNPWFTVTVFAIAMGLLESIVVIYLRELYYPGGFTFPLKAMKPGILYTELLRELATLVMLVFVGVLAGKNRTTRFAWFIFAFAAWDLAYYAFLKLLLGWPSSLLSWDILFLIPVTWVGPVLGPVINSATMIVLSILLIIGNQATKIKLNSFEWFLLISGSLVVILAYTKEYSGFMFSRVDLPGLLALSNKRELISYAATFVPARFNWMLFLSGVLLHWLTLGSLVMRMSFRGMEEGNRKLN